MKVTREDVVKAALSKDIDVLEALSLMQTAAAKMGDEDTLSQLCDIKSEILFGDEPCVFCGKAVESPCEHPVDLCERL